MVFSLYIIIVRKTRKGEHIVKNKSQLPDITTALDNFVQKLTENTDARHARSMPERIGKVKYIYSTRGSRFIKVQSVDSTYTDNAKPRINCFVERMTGDIYKPATWRQPYTKGDNAVRGNVYDPETFKDAGPYGGWLYYKEDK